MALSDFSYYQILGSVEQWFGDFRDITRIESDASDKRYRNYAVWKQKASSLSYYRKYICKTSNNRSKLNKHRLIVCDLFCTDLI